MIRGQFTVQSVSGQSSSCRSSGAASSASPRDQVKRRRVRPSVAVLQQFTSTRVFPSNKCYVGNSIHRRLHCDVSSPLFSTIRFLETMYNRSCCVYVIENRDHSEVEMSSSAESSGGMSRTLTVYDPFRVCAQSVFTARCYASAVLAMALCPSVRPSVRPSQVGVLLKRLNVGSHKQHHTIAQGV